MAGCSASGKDAPRPKPRDKAREARVAMEFDAEELVASAGEHMHGGKVVDPYDALAKLNRAVATNPANARAHYLRAVVHEYLGNRAQALSDLDTAVALDPDNSKQLFMRGGFRLQQGRHQEAMDDFQRAAEIDPNSPAAFGQMGIAAGAMGNFEDAVDYFTQALARNPALVPNYALRAKAWQALGKEEKAMADFTEAVSLAPGIPEYRMDRAALARRLGQDDRARDDLEQALFLMPDSTAVRLALSRLLSTSAKASVREPERALELIRTVTAMQGNSPDTYDARALALAAMGEFTKAAQAQANALKLLDNALNPNRAAAFEKRLESYRKGRMPEMTPFGQ